MAWLQQRGHKPRSRYAEMLGLDEDGMPTSGGDDTGTSPGESSSWLHVSGSGVSGSPKSRSPQQQLPPTPEPAAAPIPMVKGPFHRDDELRHSTVHRLLGVVQQQLPSTVDSEAVIRTLCTRLVDFVAYQSAAAELEGLVSELEAYQAQIWHPRMLQLALDETTWRPPPPPPSPPSPPPLRVPSPSGGRRHTCSGGSSDAEPWPPHSAVGGSGAGDRGKRHSTSALLDLEVALPRRPDSRSGGGGGGGSSSTTGPASEPKRAFAPPTATSSGRSDSLDGFLQASSSHQRPPSQQRPAPPLPQHSKGSSGPALLHPAAAPVPIQLHSFSSRAALLTPRATHHHTCGHHPTSPPAAAGGSSQPGARPAAGAAPVDRPASAEQPGSTSGGRPPLAHASGKAGAGRRRPPRDAKSARVAGAPPAAKSPPGLLRSASVPPPVPPGSGLSHQHPDRTLWSHGQVTPRGGHVDVRQLLSAPAGAEWPAAPVPEPPSAAGGKGSKGGGSRYSSAAQLQQQAEAAAAASAVAVLAAAVQRRLAEMQCHQQDTVLAETKGPPKKSWVVQHAAGWA